MSYIGATGQHKTSGGKTEEIRLSSHSLRTNNQTTTSQFNLHPSREPRGSRSRRRRRRIPVNVSQQGKGDVRESIQQTNLPAEDGGGDEGEGVLPQPEPQPATPGGPDTGQAAIRGDPSRQTEGVAGAGLQDGEEAAQVLAAPSNRPGPPATGVEPRGTQHLRQAKCSLESLVMTLASPN